MLPVVAFGEILIDFARAGLTRGDGVDIPVFHQFPGGAPANVAVAVARLGGRAFFAGQVSRDVFGDFLLASLRAYGVATDFVAIHPTAPTALAFVTIDEAGERSFAFRRSGTADLLVGPEFVRDEWFAGRGLFHTCSNLLMEPPSEAATVEALRRARMEGCVASFDVNLRPALWPEGRDPRLVIGACVRLADILKVSREEADFLAAGLPVADAARAWLSGGCALVLVTDGANPVRWFTARDDGVVAPPTVVVRDTTAAGDAFAGALLFRLASADVTRECLDDCAGDSVAVEAAVRFAVRCASVSVTRAGAFPSLPTPADLAAAPEGSDA